MAPVEEAGDGGADRAPGGSRRAFHALRACFRLRAGGRAVGNTRRPQRIHGAKKAPRAIGFFIACATQFDALELEAGLGALTNTTRGSTAIITTGLTGAIRDADRNTHFVHAGFIGITGFTGA